MSFPWLLVKVKRHKSISITYKNEQGEPCEWNNIDQATSELLQVGYIFNPKLHFHNHND
jgi:peptide deformylase